METENWTTLNNSYSDNSLLFTTPLWKILQCPKISMRTTLYSITFTPNITTLNFKQIYCFQFPLCTDGHRKNSSTSNNTYEDFTLFIRNSFNFQFSLLIFHLMPRTSTA